MPEDSNIGRKKFLKSLLKTVYPQRSGQSKDFDMTSGQLFLQNYADIDPTVFKPYELRVYLLEKYSAKCNFARERTVEKCC